MQPFRSLPLIAATLFIACGAPEAPVPAPEPSAPAPARVASQRCFLSVTRSADGSITDTMRISYTVAGNTLSGRMDWLPWAKDRMTGTLQGTVDGDVANVWYTYFAEGTRTMENKFLRLGKDYVAELDGPLVERPEGGLVLADPANATEGLRVPEVPCP